MLEQVSVIAFTEEAAVKEKGGKKGERGGLNQPIRGGMEGGGET